MSVKFTYNREYGLQVDTDEDGEELTEQQATIVALNRIGGAIASIAEALWEINNEFGVKKFYDSDPPQQSKPTAKPIPKKARSKPVKRQRRS